MIKFLRYIVNPQELKRAIILVQLFVLTLLVGCRTQLGRDLERFNRDLERFQLMSMKEKVLYEKELKELKAQVEAGLYATQYLPNNVEIDPLPLARELGCLEDTYPGLTEEAKILFCWGVFNRVDSDDYPDDIESVLLQEGQFNEYDPNKAVTEENYVIAVNQISRWLNGDIRPCGEGAVYITVSSEGVELRDQWDEKARCNKWVA